MNKTITMVVIAVIIAGGSFYAGMKYGGSQTTSNQTATRTRGTGNFTGGAVRGAGGNGGGFTSGSIISKDSQSITLSLQAGGSKIVFVSPTTQIMKTDAGTLTDLTVGTQVSVTGSTNSDGSVTAQSVQIRPAGFGQRQATSTGNQ